MLQNKGKPVRMTQCTMGDLGCKGACGLLIKDLGWRFNARCNIQNHMARRREAWGGKPLDVERSNGFCWFAPRNLLLILSVRLAPDSGEERELCYYSRAAWLVNGEPRIILLITAEPSSSSMMPIYTWFNDNTALGKNAVVEYKTIAIGHTLM